MWVHHPSPLLCKLNGGFHSNTKDSKYSLLAQFIDCIYSMALKPGNF